MNRDREDMTEKFIDDRICNYLTGKVKVKVGGTVIVPVGYGEEVSATVVSVGKYLKSSAPYPIENMKTVRRKGRRA